MKIDPYHKYNDYQQKRIYQLHLNKMNQINSRKVTNLDQSSSSNYNDSRIISPSKLSNYSRRIKDIKIIDDDNYRLFKKLKLINQRKSNFKKQSKSQKQYSARHLKSRKFRNREKQKQIQQENDHLVSRLISQRNSSKQSLKELSLSRKKKTRKSKKRHSTFLPNISQPNIIPQIDNNTNENQLENPQS